MQEPKLKGQVALVTGAGRGLGRAYAHRLSALGARVAVLDLSLKSYADYAAERETMEGDSTVSEIEARGGEAIGLEVDVTDSSAVNRAVERIVDRWGRLDVAVCNAGGGVGTLAETTGTLVSDAHLETVMQRNLHGTINTCRAAAVPMKAQRAGRLITISSLDGRRPEPTGGYAHYGAAKAAIIMYTKYLAREVGALWNYGELCCAWFRSNRTSCSSSRYDERGSAPNRGVASLRDARRLRGRHRIPGDGTGCVRDRSNDCRGRRHRLTGTGRVVRLISRTDATRIRERLHRHDHLPELRAAFQIAMGRHDIFELERLCDDRVQGAGRKSLVYELFDRSKLVVTGDRGRQTESADR